MIHNLSAASGASIQIHEHGAQLVSWIPESGGERLYLSPLSVAAPGAAMRGGVPIIFPQFADRGPYARHGFARRLPWTWNGAETLPDGRVRATLELRESAESLAEWPFVFRCALEVEFGGPELTLMLRVENPGDRPFRFSAALHTYLAVRNAPDARLLGLQGARYRDAAGGMEQVQAEASPLFGAEIDRVYPFARSRLELHEAGHTLNLLQQGFTDTVIWNPGPQKGAALPDLPRGGWREFVCVEAALIDPPVTLLPGGDWSGMQRLHAG